MARSKKPREKPNKDALLGSLNAVRNNVMYGLLASRLVPQSELDTLEDERLLFRTVSGKEVGVHPRKLIHYLRVPENRKAQIREFEIALLRMLVRETFEAIFWYSRVTGQERILITAPWYYFAKLMRHITSHERGGFLTEWGLRRRSIVTWHHHKLDKSMLGKPVQFTLGDEFQLCQEIYEFGDSRLK